MKIIPAMPETKIEVEDGIVKITQEASYKTNVISIPVAMFDQVSRAITVEISGVKPAYDIATDTFDEGEV
jgi:pyrroline-5-carboxylate reductase